MRYLILILLCLAATPSAATDPKFERDMLAANRAHHYAAERCGTSRYPGYCQDLANAKWKKAIARAEHGLAHRKMLATIREQDARIRATEREAKR